MGVVEDTGKQQFTKVGLGEMLNDGAFSSSDDSHSDSDEEDEEERKGDEERQRVSTCARVHETRIRQIRETARDHGHYGQKNPTGKRTHENTKRLKCPRMIAMMKRPKSPT